jgi:uncharacterized protein YeaO (DUF488 family)
LKTSYFGKSGQHPNAVSIAAITPSWFRKRIYKKFAPPWNLVKRYKDGQVTEEQYKRTYQKEILSKLDPKQVAEELGQEAILLCYEKSGQFCHRHLVADWFQRAGIKVEEI